MAVKTLKLKMPLSAEDLEAGPLLRSENKGRVIGKRVHSHYRLKLAGNHVAGREIHKRELQKSNS